MISVIIFILSVLATQTTNGQNQNYPSANLNPFYNEEDPTAKSRFNFFDLELLRGLDYQDNYFLSPASIKVALAMILEGAKQDSASQISIALRISTDPLQSRSKITTLLRDLNSSSENLILKSVNLVSVSKNLQVVPEFENVINGVYATDVKRFDYSNADTSARELNEWARQSTDGLISDIVRPEHFNGDTALVIANALHFQGKWKIKFTDTRVKDFHTKAGVLKVDTMTVSSNFRYGYIEELDARALELPYTDGKHAMLILLPRDDSTVEAVQKDLLHSSIAEIVNKLEATEVVVSLPKFSIDYSADLVPTLLSFGVTDIFSEKANLSGITTQERLKVSRLLHKAKLSVDEKGTTAAAVTAGVVVPLMGGSTVNFFANRPFLFFIYNMNTNNILFEGRLNHPPLSYNRFSTEPNPESYPSIQNHKNQNTIHQSQAPTSTDKRKIQPQGFPNHSQIYYNTETVSRYGNY